MTKLLNNEQVRHKISEIVSGKKLVVVKDKKGEYETLVFHIPSHEVKLEADLVYDQTRIRALMQDIPSREEMEQQIIEKKMIDHERLDVEEADLKEKIKHIDNIINRSKSKHQIAEKSRERMLLDRQLKRIYMERNEPYMHTAEAKAEQSRTLFLIVNGIYTESNTKKWDSVDKFLVDEKYNLQSELISTYLEFAEGLPINEVRYIARHLEWKIYWKSGKNTHSPLFFGPVTSWDINKLLIVYWSELYDNLMQYPEPPDEDVINDDIRLDKWLEEKNMLRKSQQNVTMTHKDGKAKTTYHVNEPYRLVTNKELENSKEGN